MSRPLAALLILLSPCLAGCDGGTRPNVLLITLDTTRADHLGCYGYPFAHTPNLDRLAAEGVRATDDATAAPITLPAHSTIMTGLFPPTHGVRDNGNYALSDDAITLAERFRAAGYRTQAFVSAVVLDRRYGLNQGFEGYDDDLWAEDDPKLFMIRSRPARRTAAHAGAWLERWALQPAARRAPFFVWVHFFDPHQPYERSPEFGALTATPYDAEIAAADSGVGSLLAVLERHRVLDDTLVVATADHGESLGEHGEKTHAIFVYEATVHVPLLLRWPGRLPRGAVYDGAVRSVDLFPTLLAAAGLPPGRVQGSDLLAALRRGRDRAPRPQYFESLLSEVGFGMAPLLGIREGGLKWIRAPRPELYDLRRDPHELRNLYPQQRRAALALDRELDGVLAGSQSWRLRGKANPLDHETLQNLQALGYLAPPTQRAAMAGMDPKDGIAFYDAMDEARHLVQRGKWPAAETMLRALLTQLPANVSARNVLAIALLREEKLEDARQEYERSLADDPGQARVYAMLGVLDILDSDLDRAEQHLHQAVTTSPGFVEALSNLGMVRALRGDTHGAEQWYRKALAADPHFPRLRRRLGDLYYERGQFEAALAEYRRTLATLPDDLDSLVQAGNCARRVGDAAVAEGYFQRAEALRPDSWIPTYNRACLAAIGGRTADAVRLLAAAIDRGLANRTLLRDDPDLATVRRQPEFRRLLEKVAAYQEG